MSEIQYLKNEIENNFNIDFTLLNNFLITNKGFISGSLTLSAILNEKFENQDLDLWISCGVDSSCILKIKEDFEEKFPDLKYKKKYNKLELNNKYSFSTLNRFDNINTIYYYENAIGESIQLIFIKYNMKELLNLFDFSFCCNSWNGRTFYSMYYDLTNEKKGYILHQPKSKFDKDRINKYKNRGFLFIEKNNYNLRKRKI